jgi:hypothetical protein
MQTQSNEKSCSKYVAKDNETQLAILRRKVSEMQGALETKMRRHYEQPGTGTKTVDAECKEFSSLQTHVAKTLARIDVNEEKLPQRVMLRSWQLLLLNSTHPNKTRAILSTI